MARAKAVAETTPEAPAAPADPGAVALKFHIDKTEPDANGAPTKYFDGVPCRDLTADEVGALPEHMRRGLVASGIYTTE